MQHGFSHSRSPSINLIVDFDYDYGHHTSSCAVVHPHSLLKLQGRTGGTCIVKGETNTKIACTLLACDYCDINTIRISKVTRRNLHVHQGDFVTVNFMFNELKAQQIHISPFEESIDGVEGNLFKVQ
jgi:transitional endoplasmic reticulum ATPase